VSAGERREGTFAVEWFSGGCVPMAGVRAASSASRSRQQWRNSEGPVGDQQRDRETKGAAGSVSFIEPRGRTGREPIAAAPHCVCGLTVDSSAKPGVPGAANVGFWATLFADVRSDGEDGPRSASQQWEGAWPAQKNWKEL